MKQLEIIEENGKTRIKTDTEGLTKEDAVLMLLNAYIGVCNAYDVEPIKLLVSTTGIPMNAGDAVEDDEDDEEDYDCCNFCGQKYAYCYCGLC